MIRYIILGIVQGLTEFLPVSSSGHLALLQRAFGMQGELVFLDVVLHVGTLCSLCVFFRTDLFILFSNVVSAVIDILFRRRISYVMRYNDKFRLACYIVVTAFITGVIGLTAKDFFEGRFESMVTIGIGFAVTGAVLFLTKRYRFGQRYLRHILLRDALLLGLTQSCAILPGVSRSGITIATLFFRNIEEESAFKFSFLVSIPVIAGAFIVKLGDCVSAERTISIFYLAVGFAAAFVSGICALHLLARVIRKKVFYRFAFYCFLMSVITLVFMH